MLVPPGQTTCDRLSRGRFLHDLEPKQAFKSERTSFFLIQVASNAKQILPQTLLKSSNFFKIHKESLHSESFYQDDLMFSKTIYYKIEYKANLNQISFERSRSSNKLFESFDDRLGFLSRKGRIVPNLSWTKFPKAQNS